MRSSNWRGGGIQNQSNKLIQNIGGLEKQPFKNIKEKGFNLVFGPSNSFQKILHKSFYTRSVQTLSDLFLSRQQGMSELPVQSVAAHTHSCVIVKRFEPIHFFLCKAFSAGGWHVFVDFLIFQQILLQ